MNEEIRMQLAALNAAWQRYARTAEEQLDLATAEALNCDYVKRGKDWMPVALPNGCWSMIPPR